jgi:hypothetical protein
MDFIFVVYFTELSVSGIIQVDGRKVCQRVIGKESEGNVRSIVAVICENLPGRNKEDCSG